MHFLSIKFLALILLQFSLIKPELLRKLNAFQQEEGIRNAIVTASVVKTRTGESVLQLNPEVSVNPASTLKLITTATALASLGNTYRFETELAYSGTIENGTLNGDLLIIPDYDPSLGSERGKHGFQEVLSTFSDAVKQAGIKRISGKLLIMDEAQLRTDIPDSWIWGDLGNYYGAAARKFNINENLYTVSFNAGNKLNEPVVINQLIPYSDTWKIINEVKTGPAGSGDQVYIYSSPQSQVLHMTGTVPLGSKNFLVKGSIPDPALLFSRYLRIELENIGIRFDQSPQPVFSEDLILTKPRKTLLKIYSNTLDQLTKDCNYYSINLYADAFLKKLTDKPFKESTDFLRKFWESKGTSLTGFLPKDGSGLSLSGYITTKNMTDLLTAMARNKTFTSFFGTIPVVGSDGSVKYKDPGNLTQGRLRAKSGSIEGTRAYAGYFRDKTGEQFAFMICINRFNPDVSSKVRQFLDNFILDMAKN
jgi:D-alanyl-D-alanine carboxypeptidase/D-alanyl-D-alanine-endopeptidase (penicillin-binding protein 4)